MQAPTYVALSNEMALSRQMEVVANNLANASTPSFKAEHVLFAEYIDRKGSSPVAFVQDFGTARDLSEGPLSRTGNPLDIALQGEGYLKVDTPWGVRYTRNGRLQLDTNGQLVTAQGHPVLDDGDQPISVPSDAKSITITHDGAISTDKGQAGKIEVVRFQDERALQPVAGGLFVTAEQPSPATATTVLQGMIEDSNVKPIVEMTRMMKIAQNYTSTKNLIDAESDRVKNAIDKLGSVV
jgi:flagellar basal-body rod protein FlgF